MSKVSKKNRESLKIDNTLVPNSDDNGSLIKKSFLLSALACLFSTFIFNKSQGVNSLSIVIVGLALVVGTAVFLAVNKKLTARNVLILLLISGFLLRLDYVLYTTITSTSRVRQHDLFQFGGEKGHSAYIEHFYNNGFKLPDFNPTTKAQFYHPPLHHFIVALWMRLLTTFGMSYERAISSIQYLTLFYSCCCMFVSERIFSKLNLRGVGLNIAMAIVVFHPTFIILAGSINNDILSVLFILLAIYTTLRWYQESTVKNILLIALSVGFGMMTKLSVALIAFPIALVFLIKFVNAKKEMFSYFTQYCAFGCLCIPLGMWFSIRNSIKYKVPFNYVMRQSDTSDQYIGFHSLYERLFDYSYHPFSNVFENMGGEAADYYEYNPFVAIIKTSIFGEYNYTSKNEFIVTPCRILLYINMALIALSLIAFVYCLVKKSDFLDRTQKIFFAFYQILLFLNFIVFSFEYPHSCSMDFRYIVPTLVIGAMFIGIFVEQCRKQSKKSFSNAVMGVSIGLTSLFSIFSTVVYIMLGAK